MRKFEVVGKSVVAWHSNNTRMFYSHIFFVPQIFLLKQFLNFYKVIKRQVIILSLQWITIFSLREGLKSTFEQVIGKCRRIVMASIMGKRLLTCSFWFCYALLFLSFCCKTLSYDSGCQPLHCTCQTLHCTCVLLYNAVYWCSVHARSVKSLF